MLSLSRVLDWQKSTASITQRQVTSLLSRLDFKSEVNEHTGELTEWPKYYQHSNLRFVIVPERSGMSFWLEVSGSLHKFWEGGSNYKPFHYKEVCQTISYITHLCQIPPTSFFIRQLEFGVNLTSLPVTAKTLLKSLIGYKNKGFNLMRSKGGKPIGYVASLIDYELKLYDKAKQYNLPYEVLRVEAHYRCHTNRLGLRTLSDLAQVDKLSYLGEDLALCVGQIVFDDELPHFEQLRPSQQRFIERGRNPRYFREFTMDQRTRFRNLMQQHGSYHYSEVIRGAVVNEWETLGKA